MSCWHGWHGCGPWPAWAGPRVAYGPPDLEAEWWEDVDWPMRRRRRWERGPDRESATVSLEARLEELHAELRRVETALEELRRAGRESTAE